MKAPPRTHNARGKRGYRRLAAQHTTLLSSWVSGGTSLRLRLATQHMTLLSFSTVHWASFAAF